MLAKAHAGAALSAAGYPWCFDCLDGKCAWAEYKYAGVGTGVDKRYCINGYDATNTCQLWFHPNDPYARSHLVRARRRREAQRERLGRRRAGMQPRGRGRPAARTCRLL